MSKFDIELVLTVFEMYVKGMHKKHIQAYNEYIHIRLGCDHLYLCLPGCLTVCLLSGWLFSSGFVAGFRPISWTSSVGCTADFCHLFSPGALTGTI